MKHLEKIKYGLLLLVFTINISWVNAQESQTAELKVRMNPILSFTLIDINPTLVFDDADDFINGVTYTAQNAAKVTATLPFDLAVQSDDTHLRDGTGNKFRTTNVRVEPIGEGLGILRRRRIDVEQKTIIRNAPACIEKSFDLTYSTKPGDNTFVKKPSGDYTVLLIFIATLD